MIWLIPSGTLILTVMVIFVPSIKAMHNCIFLFLIAATGTVVFIDNLIVWQTVIGIAIIDCALAYLLLKGIYLLCNLISNFVDIGLVDKLEDRLWERLGSIAMPF